jgi:putative transposase
MKDIMAEQGVYVDHAPLDRWVATYSPLIAESARRREAPVDRSGRMDDTYLKVRDEWTSPYRAFEKFGKTLDFASWTFGSCSRSGATRQLRRNSSLAHQR